MKEGRSFEIGSQVLVHCKLLSAKAMVVSIAADVGTQSQRVRLREASASERNKSFCGAQPTQNSVGLNAGGMGRGRALWIFHFDYPILKARVIAHAKRHKPCTILIEGSRDSAGPGP
jgi:hypothetical protein